MLQFASQDTPEMRSCFKDPQDPDTFARSRLDPTEQNRHPEIVRLHTDLLALRRNDVSLREGCTRSIDGAVLGETCFVLRYLTPNKDDRLIVVNLGTGLDLLHLPDPLVGPPTGHQWEVKWSSESPAYGGAGASAPGRFGAWHVPGESAQLLIPVRAERPIAPDPPKNGLG
jgi:maltooligosyltrehalose trehalohydrolase